MTFLLEWVKQIFTICVFTGILVHLVPGDKYQRYIKFTSSVLIILVCINPVTTLLAGEDNIKKSLDDFNRYINRHVERNYGNMGFLKDDLAGESYYEEAVVEYIESRVLDYGLYPVGTEVLIDWDEASESYGTLQKITINISSKKNLDSGVNIEQINTATDKNISLPEGVAQLKAELAEYYEINPANVNIYERR